MNAPAYRSRRNICHLGFFSKPVMYVFYDTINKVKKKQRPNKVHNTYITYRIVQNNASHAVNIVKLIKFCKQLSYMHVLRYKKK